MTTNRSAPQARRHAGTRSIGRRSGGGFTLVELLIVLAIIVLVAAIAVPSFRAMTGARSTEAVHNQLSALLGRARADAVAVQKVHGVAFFLDPAGTGRVQAYVVREVQRPANAEAVDDEAGVDVYLDLMADRDPLLMPDGVGLQMVDDADVDVNDVDNPNDDVRQDDAYVGFNTVAVNGVDVTFGGAILFDGYGRVVGRRFAYSCYQEVPDPPAGIDKVPSTFAEVWRMTITGASDNLVPWVEPPPSADTGTDPLPLRSQFGFVAYDAEAFANSTTSGGTAFTAGDPQLEATPGDYDPDELEEERWIDDNAVPELVNRNNGTLVRGE